MKTKRAGLLFLIFVVLFLGTGMLAKSAYKTNILEKPTIVHEKPTGENVDSFPYPSPALTSTPRFYPAPVSTSTPPFYPAPTLYPSPFPTVAGAPYQTPTPPLP